MVSDARAQQAREHHRHVAEDEARAAQHRAARNRLVRTLYAEDQARPREQRVWSYRALAGAVDCTPELIAAIIQGRT